MQSDNSAVINDVITYIPNSELLLYDRFVFAAFLPTKKNSPAKNRLLHHKINFFPAKINFSSAKKKGRADGIGTGIKIIISAIILT